VFGYDPDDDDPAVQVNGGDDDEVLLGLLLRLREHGSRLPPSARPAACGPMAEPPRGA
jgi:hypothetical protein